MIRLSIWQTLHQRTSEWDLASFAQAKLAVGDMLNAGVPERDTDVAFLLRQINSFQQLNFVPLSDGDAVFIVRN